MALRAGPLRHVAFQLLAHVVGGNGVPGSVGLCCRGHAAHPRRIRRAVLDPRPAGPAARERGRRHRRRADDLGRRADAQRRHRDVRGEARRQARSRRVPSRPPWRIAPVPERGRRRSRPCDVVRAQRGAAQRGAPPAAHRRRHHAGLPADHRARVRRARGVRGARALPARSRLATAERVVRAGAPMRARRPARGAGR